MVQPLIDPNTKARTFVIIIWQGCFVKVKVKVKSLIIKRLKPLFEIFIFQKNNNFQLYYFNFWPPNRSEFIGKHRIPNLVLVRLYLGIPWGSWIISRGMLLASLWQMKSEVLKLNDLLKSTMKAKLEFEKQNKELSSAHRVSLAAYKETLIFTVAS